MFSNIGFKNKTNSRGYSLIELVLVMALLVIFGLSTFTLVVSGSGAYKNILDKKEANSELRVAISYINMRIRQNDSVDSVRVEKSPFGNDAAIVTEEVIDNSTYETWIFWHEGKLREALVRQGESVTVDISFVIADIDGFSALYNNDKKSILLDVWRVEEGLKKDYSSLVFLKSAL
jgi:prepilin-type N-terminal cleavage/methylation domain-containing protein